MSSDTTQDARASSSSPENGYEQAVETPCALIDRYKKGLKRAMIGTQEQPRLRCGVLGVVKSTGKIALADPVAVKLPLPLGDSATL